MIIKKLTQREVAKLAGVSQTTVSQVLNNNTSIAVPQETRQRVLDVIKQQGYIPDRAAQSLRTGKSYTIVSIISDITNPFYPAFVRGIQDVAETHSYNVITYNTDGLAYKEDKYMRLVQPGQVDGVIMASFNTSAYELRPLLEKDLPFVLLGEPVLAEDFEGLPLDTIWVNPVKAAQTAVSYLISKGHQRIAMITSKLGKTGLERLEGYRKALLTHGIEADDNLVIWVDDYTEQNGVAGMKTVLNLANRPTAIFTANDLLAMGVLMVAKEAQIRVPDDIAVMGFDDIPAAKLVSPALTTICQFQQKLGQRAAEMLFERLNKSTQQSVRNIEMPYELITRQSV